MTHLFYLRAGGRGGGSASLGATYYVSPTGNDNAAGTSPATAWKTLAKVSTRILAPGDCILLERGGTFYASELRIRGVGGQQLVAGGAKVTIADYGDTSLALPTISGWKVTKPAGWSLYAAGVWRIAINVDVTGNTYVTGAPGANIGRLLVDGEIKTIKRLALADLTGDWDFFSDNAAYLYVRSDVNPGTRATEIKASPNIGGMIGRDTSTRWRNLRITGSGGHGALLAASDVDIQACWFDCLGGSVQGDDHAKPRYGNGAESFARGARHVVTNCLFTDIFDVATTAQGYPMATANDGWSDIDFSDNWIARTTWAVEYWATVDSAGTAGLKAPDGCAFTNVRARRLRLWDMGRGPCRFGRYTAQVWSAFIQTADIQTPYQPLIVSVAEMHNCSDNLFFFSLPSSGSPGYPYRRSTTDFVLEPSRISMPAGSRIMRGNQMPTYTIEQWDDFVAATGIGRYSIATVEPAMQGMTPISEIYAKWRASL